jgi:hypothetical protein
MLNRNAEILREMRSIVESAELDEMESPQQLAGTIERFSSTINKRLGRARNAARNNKLDTAWKELDSASWSLQSLLKAINIARRG